MKEQTAIVPENCSAGCCVCAADVYLISLHLTRIDYPLSDHVLFSKDRATYTVFPCGHASSDVRGQYLFMWALSEPTRPPVNR